MLQLKAHPSGKDKVYVKNIKHRSYRNIKDKVHKQILQFRKNLKNKVSEVSYTVFRHIPTINLKIPANCRDYRCIHKFDEQS